MTRVYCVSTCAPHNNSREHSGALIIVVNKEPSKTLEKINKSNHCHFLTTDTDRVSDTNPRAKTTRTKHPGQNYPIFGRTNSPDKTPGQIKPPDKTSQFSAGQTPRTKTPGRNQTDVAGDCLHGMGHQSHYKVAI